MRVNQTDDAAEHRSDMELVETVIHYHVQTKHHYQRYARSAGYLDWANQPNPFRRYEGTILTPLPLLAPDEAPVSPSYHDIYQGAVPRHRVTVKSLSRFFELALALSAWKRAGESEWPLRSNPSSGNLHPTEGYVLIPALHGLEMKPGLYHYAPKEHGLELRAEFHAHHVADMLHPFPSEAFLVGLTSVHWREAWKYGERAFRYCHHDVGHAIGTVRIAASTLGWQAVLLDGCAQDSVAGLTGTQRSADFSQAEAEHPDCLMAVWPANEHSQAAAGTMPLYVDPAHVQASAEAQWFGTANRLSAEHGFDWEIIETVARATWKRQTDKMTISLNRVPANASPQGSLTQEQPASPPNLPAAQIIRHRRSAVAFDAATSISASTFFRMLERVMPQHALPQLSRPMPWDVWPHDPLIHLMLFVHRIDGLTPGLYFLIRDPGKLRLIQESMNAEINWEQVPGCPEGLPLYWLLEGDAKKLAAQVSCHQDIAGDSAFSLGMLAEFEDSLRQRGAWWYPRMFWEAGLLGQVLYLEAEAAGVRATGIGCFFDDPVHEIVAIRGLSLQSLYHFTVGGPVEDRRLLTLPPYGRRKAGPTHPER
jgi:SagB-type dehydrogenase family enzyme